MTSTMRYTDLVHGEMYSTTKEHTYSNYDEDYAQMIVPVGEKLIFRSFQPYGKHTEKELSLFYWLKNKISICLVVCEKTPILHIRHLEWENRNDEPIEILG